MKTPLVSIVTITYNQEKYIIDTIKSVLNQKTDFSCEYIIADDCSTDNTHHNISKFLKTANHNCNIQYTRHVSNKGMNGNLSWALQQANGKYIALCEGDDFWLDPLKLSKQVNILENISEMAMCTHEAYHWHLGGSDKSMTKIKNIIFHDTKVYGFWGLLNAVYKLFLDNNNFWELERCHLDRNRKKINTLNDMTDGKWYMPFCSILMRKSVIEPFPKCYYESDGGHQLTLLLGAMKGGIYHLTDIMAVKRDQETSVTKNKQRKQRIAELNKNINTNNRIKRYRCLQQLTRNKNEILLLQKLIDREQKKNNFQSN